ncbi:DNA polymerase IV [Coralloluteibacterium stylophorae]|uniref:DNA polymerase IV n=1 Tax=Coralloluteibacterium stylophorae TaxID=1776034 RepID=A0A8J8AXF2_9GAMM|nr:DNA polymerase IV [Coralloluteibacterium stylophorae]MBS7458009.1 DNA polymerase IV [Coralloluteibacterium stylophorae]
MRKIVHIDMDAFYASVEQRDDPALRGRPVVVGGSGPRSVVCAASYEARRFGVRSAMPGTRARRLCPDAVFVPPDFPRYRAVSRQIREIFLAHTELVEPLSLDEAYLDVTENRQRLPTATAVASAIRAEILATTALTASAGIAPNKFLAKIASDWRKPDGQFVVRPERALDFLTPLPVGRLPGVGRVMEARLDELGIGTVGALRTLSVEALEARFGRWGRRLHQLAHGIDDSPVRPSRPSLQVSAEDTFETDLTLEELAPAIERMAARAWEASRRAGRIGRTVVLKLKTRDFRILTRSLSPPRPPRDLACFAAIALDLRARVDLPPSTRYRLVGVGLGNFVDADDPAMLQASLDLPA